MKTVLMILVASLTASLAHAGDAIHCSSSNSSYTIRITRQGNAYIDITDGLAVRRTVVGAVETTATGVTLLEFRVLSSGKSYEMSIDREQRSAILNEKGSSAYQELSCTNQ